MTSCLNCMRFGPLLEAQCETKQKSHQAVHVFFITIKSNWVCQTNCVLRVSLTYDLFCKRDFKIKHLIQQYRIYFNFRWMLHILYKIIRKCLMLQNPRANPLFVLFSGLRNWRINRESCSILDQFDEARLDLQINQITLQSPPLWSHGQTFPERWLMH